MEVLEVHNCADANAGSTIKIRHNNPDILFFLKDMLYSLFHLVIINNINNYL